MFPPLSLDSDILKALPLDTRLNDLLKLALSLAGNLSVSPAFSAGSKPMVSGSAMTVGMQTNISSFKPNTIHRALQPSSHPGARPEV